MRKNNMMRTNLLLRSLLSITFLLTTAACEACKKGDDKDENNEGKKDKKDEKTPLKFSLTPPAEKLDSQMETSKSKQLHVGDLVVKVTEGKDDSDNYTFKVVNTSYFNDDQTYPDSNINSNVDLYSPGDGVSLKVVFNEDIIEKDKTKPVAVIVSSQAKACTSKSGKITISIADKAGKVVGGPVEVKWSDRA
jgi:hypothetical protein